MFSQTELRSLAARASTIDERIAGGYSPTEGSDCAGKIACLVKSWCEAIGGDEGLLRQRLEGDGIDLDVIRPLLGDVTRDATVPLPDWAHTLSWAAPAMAAQPEMSRPSGLVDPAQPVPFEELFVSLAIAARRRCQRSSNGPLSQAAEVTLQRALMNRLGRICAPSLFDGFVLARMFRGSGFGFADFLETDASQKRTRYDRYLESLRAGELKQLFLDRPVLARLVGTIVGLWIASTDQFERRLRNDIDLIGRTFNSGQPVGDLVDLKWGLSDAHNGAETVCRLTFECGLTVGYKPKDLHIDFAWKRFIEWLADNGAPGSAVAPVVLTRPGYGWVEWLSPSPCPDRESAKRHFRHAGSLLCLFHLLRATDFHWENVLAVSDMPAPVDLETLLHPRLEQFAKRPDQGKAKGLADERLAGSVLSAGYLPHWMKLPGDHVLGIGGVNPHHDQRSRIVFQNINTDGMAYQTLPSEPKPVLNAAVLNGVPLQAVAYEHELVDGFASMYRFLLSRQDLLSGSQSPLRGFEGHKTRVVLRPTVVYAAVLQHSLSRECLSDGVSWSLNFDFLSRLSPLDHADHLLSRVQASEREALAREDIPFFATSTDGLYLELNGRDRLEACFTQSPISSVRNCAAQMSDASLERELTFIRLAVRASADQPNRTSGMPWTGHPSAPSRKESRIAAATSMGAILGQQAIRGADGVTWIGISPLPNERVEVSDVGYTLYSGSSGIALFLAALARATGSISARDLSYDALRPLRDHLDSHESRSRFARTSGIGGASGLGGIVYALTKISGFLDDDDVLADAGRFARLITKDAISADQRLDVIDGTAGALLSLLALNRLHPSDDIIETAVQCGHHLLERQTDCSPTGKAWITLDERPLTGFSHGAAGIAYALLRLSEVDRGGPWRDAATPAIGYESALYCADKQNWPDLRTLSGREPGTGEVCQWCHGATGIGMARLGGLDTLHTAGVTKDIGAAIDRTESMQRTALDHLCCGNFGRLDFLFSAGQRFGRDDLIDLSLSRADEMVEIAEATGSFNWWLADDDFNPGFFSGLAGVGYTLLRLDNPDQFPSVLLWD